MSSDLGKYLHNSQLISIPIAYLLTTHIPSKNSSRSTMQRRITRKSTTSQYPPHTFHRLPIELVNRILNIAASSSRHSCLDICLVASWARRIARPHLFHTVVITGNGFRKIESFKIHAVKPLFPPATTDSQLTAGSLVNGLWTNSHEFYDLSSVFKVCDNLVHLALDNQSFAWLCEATASVSRNKNLHVHVMNSSITYSAKPIPDQITHLRITTMDSNSVLTHLDNFRHLTHFSLSVTYCLGGMHNARELARLLKLPSHKLMMLVVALSFQVAQRGHWKELGRWVRKTREMDGRVYIVEECRPDDLQEEWEDELRGGESIWDKAVRYTRDWERTAVIVETSGLSKTFLFRGFFFSISYIKERAMRRGGSPDIKCPYADFLCNWPS